MAHALPPPPAPGPAPGDGSAGKAAGPDTTEAPASRLDKALGLVPRALASHAHVILLMTLGVYLILLPLTHLYTPSASSELIGGNYTNVTSDIGACIAAGGTLTLLRHSRKRNKLTQASHRILADLYQFHAGHPHPDAPPQEASQ